MNPRVNPLTTLAAQFKKTPPNSSVEIIERAGAILKVIFPHGNTLLKTPADQNIIQLLGHYLQYVAKDLSLQMKINSESIFVVENIPSDYLKKISDLIEKEKIVIEVEKRLSQSYTTMLSQLNIKLDTVIQLLNQRPDVIMKDMPLEKEPEGEQNDEGQVNQKEGYLQPGARL